PWQLYQTTGNTAIFKQQYDSMKRWCNYIITTAERRRGNRKLPKEVDRYLWNTGFHFGDWLIPSLSKDGYNYVQLLKQIVATRQFTAPIFGWYSVSSFAVIAELLGKAEDAAYYREIADKMKAAISYGLIDEKGNMPVNLMGAYVLPLYFDLVPKEHKKHFGEHLVKMIHDNGGCLDTGFLGTPFLLDALCKAGYRDEAYKLLYQEKCPSWLYEVKMGATTIWESWYSFREDGTPMRMSLNHYAFGCVDTWMFRYIAGMDRLKPGFREILIQPRPDNSLTYAKRSYFCEFGLIETDWHKNGNRFDLTVTVPCNTTALIVLPSGEKYRVGSGTYSYSCEVD
ncbi:MAG TPA: alpha-L-rhamnosidase C-terminal domain-containing protein, partial [Clostridiales bacterium]|nr:alpha-L-rhamnosidase C-terminal domain-containing protein [Clostridiales bacterium]